MQNNNIELQPINGSPSGLKRYKPKKIIYIILAVIFAIIVGVLSAFIIWINVQLSPLDKKADKKISINIDYGKGAFEIADELESQSIIKSSSAFYFYVSRIRKNDSLQAGRYSFSPSESVQEIVERLISGDVEKITVTFYPGATLVDNYTKDESKKYDITTSLKLAGFGEEEIKTALSKTYNSPLFQDKPPSADLEGYIYGETYSFASGTSVEDILETAFSYFYSIIEENDLIDKFKSQGLSLYEGITLASIVQREAGDSEEQKKIAQVFFLRLDRDMSLGSDVTYQYIADKNGIERDVNIDSPYNTRRYPGLPPGPIAVPGLSALLAVANPADTDYVYFLAGDDKKIYYAYTDSEHNQNIVNHCAIGCSKP